MQQLVIQFPADDVSDFDAVVELEDLLIEKLGDEAEVDGHDFGQGEMNLFIYTEDAAATFAKVRSLLSDRPLSASMSAGYREEDAEDYVPLWPEGSSGFDIA